MFWREFMLITALDIDETSEVRVLLRASSISSAFTYPELSFAV